MIHEFAVEPAALSRFNPIWQALEQFGIQHGRVISEFPRKWLRQVYDATNECSAVERKALEVRLQALKSKLASFGRPYVSAQTWRQNAHRQHLERPFRAIIQADNDTGVPDVLTEADLHDGNASWIVETHTKAVRTAASLASCVAVLGRISREILIVDPYFSTGRKWTEVLIKCLEQCGAGDYHFKRIEVHTGARGHKELDYLKSEAQRWIIPQLPPNLAIRFCLWEKVEGSERMHARYVLTEKGGIGYDVGLDEGELGETTDVNILGDALYRERWAEFQPETSPFRLQDEFTIELVRQ